MYLRPFLYYIVIVSDPRSRPQTTPNLTWPLKCELDLRATDLKVQITAEYNRLLQTPKTEILVTPMDALQCPTLTQLVLSLNIVSKYFYNLCTFISTIYHHTCHLILIQVSYHLKQKKKPNWILTRVSYNLKQKNPIKLQVNWRLRQIKFMCCGSSDQNTIIYQKNCEKCLNWQDYMPKNLDKFFTFFAWSQTM